MARPLPIILAIFLSGSAFAQRGGYGGGHGPVGAGSTMSMGNVVFPGTGHAPQVRMSNSPRLGGYGYYSAPPARRYAHPSHSPAVIVPYPVIVGGGYGYPYGYGYGPDTSAPPDGYVDQGAPPQQQPVTPPVVIINQGYLPETANPVLRDYSQGIPPSPTVQTIGPMAPSGTPAPITNGDDEKPTTYLIAFKNHTILPALAYWVEGDTLNYVTLEGQPNQASLALIDKDLSKQLNQERNVEFKLP